MAHVDDHVLAFNDLHLALAAARSPDAGDVARLRRSLDDYARSGAGDNHAHDGRGRPAADRRRCSPSPPAIMPARSRRSCRVRHQAIRIGGSHAQRDI